MAYTSRQNARSGDRSRRLYILDYKFHINMAEEDLFKNMHGVLVWRTTTVRNYKNLVTVLNTAIRSL